MNSVDYFKQNGYCLLEEIIDVNMRDFITQYALFDEMSDFVSDDQQVVGAHSKYADPAMETMLIKLHPLMEENTGLELIPTYSYYRVYRKGNELKIHKDRPSCEISCTVCFNYSYNDRDYSWPIFMDGRKINQKPGDLIIYRGCELEHWRGVFDISEDDAWHVQGFFHYVDKKGPFENFKFDQRENLGIPKNFNIKQKSYIKYTK
jgi:hypothetical protein